MKTSLSIIRHFPARRRGIALREVLLIGGLAVLLLMLLVTWVASRRGASRRATCQFRQQQTAMAMLQLEAVDDHFPGYANVQATADDQRHATGWVFPILPYLTELSAPVLADLERGEVDFQAVAEDDEVMRPYRSIYEDYGPSGGSQSKGATPHEHIPLLICPDDATMRDTQINQLSWIVNTGMADAKDFGELPADWSPNGIFQNLFDEGAADAPLVSAKYLSEHDGANHTLLMSENVDAGRWTNRDEALVGFIWSADLDGDTPAPGNDLLRINELRGEGDGSLRFARPSSFHVGGVNAVRANGSAQFMNEGIDWLVFTQLMSSWGEEAKLPGSEEPVPEIYR